MLMTSWPQKIDVAHATSANGHADLVGSQTITC
jgi:hypothetical protein